MRVGASLEAAAARPADLGAAAFSLAGADWPEDFSFLHRELVRRLELTFEPSIVNDAIGAIRGGTDDGTGVAVVCGTGGAVGARNGRGDVYHHGFWPDGTGAAALGERALAAVWRADMGLGPETSLTGRAVTRWGCSEPLELLHAFTRLDAHSIPVSEKALFAETVLDEAAAGDAVAIELVTAAGTLLGDYARVSAARVGSSSAGSRSSSAAASCAIRRRCCARRSSQRVPEGRPVSVTAAPIVGRGPARGRQRRSAARSRRPRRDPSILGNPERRRRSALNERNPPRCGNEGLRERGRRRRQRQLDHRGRRVHGARRPLGLRQVDALAHDRRPRARHRRQDLHRRART